MTYAYPYHLANDWPGGAIDVAKFKKEVAASAIGTPLAWVNVAEDADPNNVQVVFDAQLSAGDKTLLDGDVAGPAGGLIAAHDNSAVVTPRLERSFVGAAEDGQVVTLTTQTLGDKKKGRRILVDGTITIPDNNVLFLMGEEEVEVSATSILDADETVTEREGSGGVGWIGVAPSGGGGGGGDGDSGPGAPGQQYGNYTNTGGMMYTAGTPGVPGTPGAANGGAGGAATSPVAGTELALLLTTLESFGSTQMAMMMAGIQGAPGIDGNWGGLGGEGGGGQAGGGTAGVGGAGGSAGGVILIAAPKVILRSGCILRARGGNATAGTAGGAGENAGGANGGGGGGGSGGGGGQGGGGGRIFIACRTFVDEGAVYQVTGGTGAAGGAGGAGGTPTGTGVAGGAGGAGAAGINGVNGHFVLLEVF